ncbi:MAG: DUF2442 domain-containing protein [Verrucomicrobiae bacterium]|nr:DUF2442 domain-containing protein [Verrucomicrobiae bacterium]MDW8308154.1 DUF2442 domain-containing protein [Verrucomicrobiales bacterium]
MPNSIKSVRWLGGYRLKLVFNDGYVGELDLQPILAAPRGPLEIQLRDETLFQQVSCDGSTIVWPNGYDLCPDVVRFWCERGRVCAEAETEAALAGIRAKNESVQSLHDKPNP